MNQNNFKCHCLYQNGDSLKNDIACGLVEDDNEKNDGDYQTISLCEWGEWCTGPFHRNESVQGMDYGKNVLCTRGMINYPH